MSEIDEEFGRYLDSLVEPVEPEWVMGWVARRRRKRALTVTGLGLVLAATAGAVGYEIHGSPAGTVRVGTTSGSSSTLAASTTTSTVAPSSTSAASTPPRTNPPAPPPTVPATTPDTGPVQADYPYAQPGDAVAATTLSSSNPTVGVPVELTVTLVNTRDHGVYVGSGAGNGFAVYAETPDGQGSFVMVGFGAAQNMDGIELAPHAVLTASATWVPTTAASGTLRLVGEDDGTPASINVTQSPTSFTVGAGPETTTTTSTSTSSTP